jgi:hypothetical protein
MARKANTSSRTGVRKEAFAFYRAVHARRTHRPPGTAPRARRRPGHRRAARPDRWWRVTRQALYHDPATSRGDGDSDALRRYTADVPHLSQARLNVTMTSERSLRLTPDQLTDLKRDLVEVIDRYRDLTEQPGAQPVSVHIHALPLPER